MIVTIAAIVWILIGLFGFIYWYSKDFDVYGSDLTLGFAVSVLGPIAWFVGYLIHGDHKSILIKNKRK